LNFLQSNLDVVNVQHDACAFWHGKEVRPRHSRVIS